MTLIERVAARIRGRPVSAPEAIAPAQVAESAPAAAPDDAAVIGRTVDLAPPEPEPAETSEPQPPAEPAAAPEPEPPFEAAFQPAQVSAEEQAALLAEDETPVAPEEGPPAEVPSPAEAGAPIPEVLEPPAEPAPEEPGTIAPAREQDVAKPQAEARAEGLPIVEQDAAKPQAETTAGETPDLEQGPPAEEAPEDVGPQVVPESSAAKAAERAMTEFGAVGRVLLVDNERLFRELLADVLRERGYYVADAADEKQALWCLADADFDAIVMEARLNGHGAEGARAFRDACPETPLIVVTSLASRDDEQVLRDAGAALCLGKPFDIDELVNALATVARPRFAPDARLSAAEVNALAPTRPMRVPDEDLDCCSGPDWGT